MSQKPHEFKQFPGCDYCGEQVLAQAQRIAELEAVLEGLINQRNDFQDCPLWCKKDCEWCKAKTILAKKGSY
jgi:hypothetical protein